jgi:preprotein translocase subunit SecY
MVLLFNIISTIPEDFVNLYETFVASAGNVAKGVLAAVIIIAIVVVMVIFVCILQDAERRIPVQYSQKMQGRRLTGGAASNIPVKVNTAGVIPVIFASSLMSTPIIIAQFFSGSGAEWTRYLSSSYWCNPQYPKYSVGLLLYVVLVVFFAYFYTSITFNPLEIANNMKRNGGVIPGIRQGKPTSDYLNKILNYIVFIGACGLVVVAIVPILCSGVFKAKVSFGGTSIIIIVGVILETLKQIESQMVVRHCKGLFD